MLVPSAWIPFQILNFEPRQIRLVASALHNHIDVNFLVLVVIIHGNTFLDTLSGGNVSVGSESKHLSRKVHLGANDQLDVTLKDGNL